MRLFLTFSPSLMHRIRWCMFCNVEETVKVRCKSVMINAKGIDSENEGNFYIINLRLTEKKLQFLCLWSIEKNQSWQTSVPTGYPRKQDAGSIVGRHKLKLRRDQAWKLSRKQCICHKNVILNQPIKFGYFSFILILVQNVDCIGWTVFIL